MLRRLRFSVATTFALLLALGAGGGADVPWPHGRPPSSSELTAMLDEAVELADRERFEEELDAYEKGEDSEHIVVRQEDIDQNLYGYGELPRLFRFGDALFEHEFRKADGYGDTPDPTLRRVHSGVRGGLDTFSCAGCHSVGGTDGAGTLTQNAYVEGDGDTVTSANIRNPPHALGLGFVQALGAEMSRALNELRAGALAQAAEQGSPVFVDLLAKDVSFGRLRAFPDGTVDTSEVVGVDTDLVVKPFGWKGDVARLRRFVEGAARVHFGIQAHTLALGYEQDPDPDTLGPGPNWWDPDNDGKTRELEEGILTAAAVYLSMLESPVILPPHDDGLRARWGRGAALFDEVGCESCHRSTLHLDYTFWTELPDTTGGPGTTINLTVDGEHPKSSLLVHLYSDLKRHEMGEWLKDPHDNAAGVPRSVFLTRPLWGLAETAPYLHDGRALTLAEAVHWHGGEAESSRKAYEALSPEEQSDVNIFLLSLTREPKPRIAR